MESLKKTSSAIFFSNNEFILTLMQIISLCCRTPLLTKIYQGHISETHCCTDLPHTPCCCLKLTHIRAPQRNKKCAVCLCFCSFLFFFHKIMDMFMSQTFNPLEENHWQCWEVGMYRAKDWLIVGFDHFVGIIYNKNIYRMSLHLADHILQGPLME